MGFKLKPPKWNPVKTVTNLIKNPGNEIKKGAGNVLAPMWSAQIGGIKSFVGKKPPAPVAGEDPNVTALRERMFGEATDFERDAPGLISSQQSQIDREGNQALKEGIKGTRQSFNRRGLLYSGLREGGEQSVRGKVAGTMAGQKAQVNKEVGDMMKSKFEKAAQVGLQSYKDSVDREAEIAGINLQNQVARAQAMQQLGQIGGQFAGSYFANRGQQPPQTTTPTLYGDQSAMSYGGSYGQRGA